MICTQSNWPWSKSIIISIRFLKKNEIERNSSQQKKKSAKNDTNDSCKPLMHFVNLKRKKNYIECIIKFLCIKAKNKKKKVKTSSGLLHESSRNIIIYIIQMQVCRWIGFFFFFKCSTALITEIRFHVVSLHFDVFALCCFLYIFFFKFFYIFFFFKKKLNPYMMNALKTEFGFFG